MCAREKVSIKLAIITKNETYNSGSSYLLPANARIIRFMTINPVSQLNLKKKKKVELGVAKLFSAEIFLILL